MIERVAPGVYVTEIAFDAKPIEGVATSTAGLTGAGALDRAAAEPPVESPAWTQENTGDPGVTLVELFAWAAESLDYRAAHDFEQLARAAALGVGVIGGLAVDSAADGTDLNVSRGQAISPEGGPVDPEIAQVRRTIDPDPDR